MSFQFRHSCLILFAISTGTVGFAQDLSGFGLDLSAPRDFKSVVVLPPVKTVHVRRGKFVGFAAKEKKLKWNTIGHRRLVLSLKKVSSNEIIPAKATLSALKKAALTPGNAQNAQAQARLARALNVAWVVSFDFTKKGALVSKIVDFEGKPTGKKHAVPGARIIRWRHARQMAALLAKDLEEVTAARVAQQEKAAAIARAKSKKQTVDEAIDKELDVVASSTDTASPSQGVRKSLRIAQMRRPPREARVSVAVGPGMAIRNFAVDGQRAGELAELQTVPVMGLGVAVQVQPLQFFAKTKGQRWSDFGIEFHYRRAFMRAQGTSGFMDDAVCSVTEDDWQVRGTWRYRFTDSDYSPSVGIGAGFSQEQTQFSCTLPVVSALYRGVDLQLRVRQSLYRDIIAIDLAAGPRFLFARQAVQSALSFAGEAWLEVRPVAFSFMRAGARMSLLQLSNDDVTVSDTRGFFAIEVGAYF